MKTRRDAVDNMISMSTGTMDASMITVKILKARPELICLDPPYTLIGKIYGADPDGWATVEVRSDVANWLFETFEPEVDVKWSRVHDDLYISMTEKTYVMMTLRW